jgi:hypothetical protein
MRVVFDGSVVELRQESTHDELLGVMNHCKRGNVVLGEEGKFADKFWTARVLFEWNQVEAFGIGICSEKQSVPPNLFPFPSENLLVLGFNHEVVAVDPTRAVVLWRLELDSFFRWFCPVSDPSLVVAVHEIGVLGLIRQTGTVKWHYAKDVIVRLDIGVDFIDLEFLDEPRVRLSLLDGQIQP